MKTALEVCENAFALLGYTDRIGNLDAQKYAVQYRQAIGVCNVILHEIQRIEGKSYGDITELSDELDISERSINEVMPFGVAMYFANMDGDGTQQQIYSLIYNQKLGLCPRPSRTVTLNYTPSEE